MKTRNQYFLKRAALFYFLSLLLCTAVFSRRIMPWYSFVSGIGSIALFFLLSVKWEREWRKKDDKKFERSVFFSALVIRLAWILLYNAFTNIVWESPWEQPMGTSMDSTGYYETAVWAKELFDNGLGSVFFDYILQTSISDAGYPLLLLLFNSISGSSILFTRIPNALFDAWTAVLVYRLAKRNFDIKTAHVASIYTVLMPILIFYTGVTMKETVMLMLTMWGLDLGDRIIREQKLDVWKIVAFALIAFLLYLFRDVLTWVLLIALFGAYSISSPRIKQASQRTIILVLIVSVVMIVAGGTILQQYEAIESQISMTEDNFVHRSNTNALVSGLTKGIFAPLMFTIPFPTMVDVPGQYIQAIQNGGFFLKNILSFFCVFGIIDLFRKSNWRNSSFLLEFLIGYLIVLGVSSFAHSGRFHHPVICIELIFAAYGMQAVRTIRQAKMFNLLFMLEVVFVVGWNWFKLAGRGL